MLRALILVVALVLAGCADSGGREQLTVVLEANRARAQEDQARLADMQKALDDAKHDLVDLRERLLKAGAISAEESRRLEEREQALAAHGTTSTTSAPGLTKADVEELLRAQEARLKGEIQPSTTTVVERVAAAPENHAPDEVAAQLTAAAKLRAERGLRQDDVPEGPKLQRRVDEGLKTHRGDDALVAARALVDATNHTSVDGAFIKKKYERVNAALGGPRVDAEKKAAITKLLGDATHEKNAGNLAAANEKLNAALDLL